MNAQSLQLAAASSSREEHSHAPAIAPVVDDAASGLDQPQQQIINAPTLQPRLLVAFTREESGTTASSSRAKHEGLATPVISASEQVVSPGSVGSLPAEPGGAQIAVAQPGSALSFSEVARSNRASDPVGGSIPPGVSTGAGCDSGAWRAGLVPSQVGRREERSPFDREAA